MIQTLAEAADQIGERKTRNRLEGGVRQYSKATQANPINEAIRTALKNLSRSWKRTGKRGRVEKSACGNPGQIKEQNPDKHREQAGNSNNYIYKTNSTNNSNQEQHIQDNTGRNSELSVESAKLIQPNTTPSALDDLIQLYETTPEAKNEHERIDALMRAVVGDADTPPS